jgi:hypothetical protein
LHTHWPTNALLHAASLYTHDEVPPIERLDECTIQVAHLHTTNAPSVYVAYLYTRIDGLPRRFQTTDVPSNVPHPCCLLAHGERRMHRLWCLLTSKDEGLTKSPIRRSTQNRPHQCLLRRLRLTETRSSLPLRHPRRDRRHKHRHLWWVHR